MISNKYLILLVLGVGLCLSNAVSWITITGVLLLAWLALGGYYTVYLMYHTLGRDMR